MTAPSVERFLATFTRWASARSKPVVRASNRSGVVSPSIRPRRIARPLTPSRSLTKLAILRLASSSVAALAILQSTKRAPEYSPTNDGPARGHSMRCGTSSPSNLTMASQHQSGGRPLCHRRRHDTLFIRRGALPHAELDGTLPPRLRRRPTSRGRRQLHFAGHSHRDLIGIWQSRRRRRSASALFI